MFCPNCGKELVKLNQRFCHICGIDLSMVFNRPQLRTESAQYAPIAKSQSVPVYTSFPVSQQKPDKKPDKILEEVWYSKKCFGFGLVSCAIAVFCAFSGGAILLISMLSGYAFRVGLIGFIISIIANSVGLTFGILSRKYNAKAGNSNPLNYLKKLGSVFGILGIIFNAIQLGLALIIMGIIIAFATL